jgi:hypothetical protein
VTPRLRACELSVSLLTSIAVTELQQSPVSIVCVLQALRVTSMFLAQQVGREPLHMEAFETGELLFALSSDDGYTVFCRHDETADLDDRRQFVIGDKEFERRTIRL